MPASLKGQMQDKFNFSSKDIEPFFVYQRDE